jgi:hypothetical protein
MTRWETDLTTRDTNRIVRPLEWGFDWLEDFAGQQRVPKAEGTPRQTKEPGLKPAATPEGQSWGFFSSL